MFESIQGGDVLIRTVSDVAHAAMLAGVRPSELLDRLLCALEDDARVDG